MGTCPNKHTALAIIYTCARRVTMSSTDLISFALDLDWGGT